MKQKIFIAAIIVSICLLINSISYAWEGEGCWGPITRSEITSIASEMIDSYWLPRKDINNFVYGTTWHEFPYQPGVPHQGEAYCFKSTPDNWEEFVKNITNTPGGDTYYGNDCSGFASISWKLPTRYTTLDFEYDATHAGGYLYSLGDKGNAEDVSLLQGDALVSRVEGLHHIILFNRHYLSGMESMEQAPWKAQRIKTTVWSDLPASYRPIRRNLIETTPATPLNIGDNVEVIWEPLSVRDTPGGVFDEFVHKGDTGKIIDGPKRAELIGPNGPQWWTWWKIKWDNDIEGWSVECGIGNTTVVDNPPTVNAFSVGEPHSAPLGDPFTIFYTVSDDIGLRQVELWRATDTNGDGHPDWPTGLDDYIDKDLLSDNGPTPGSFSDTPSSIGNYWYGIHVVDNAGTVTHEPDPPGPIKVIVTGSPPPPPTGVSASDGDYTDKIRITWNAYSGATYEVYRAASSGGSKSKIETPSNTSYDDTSASVGNTYYYWVKAKNAYGTSGYSSSDIGYLKTLCTYDISPKSKTFVPSGGSSTVGVTAPSGCSWSAASNKAWISITSGSSDSGNGTVHYSVLANSSTSSRTGTMTIAGKTFTVTQDPLPPCTFSISPPSKKFSHSGGSQDVAVTASRQDCTWSASESLSWVTLSKTSGTGNETVTITVSSNSGASRTGTVGIAGKTFPITQDPLCTYDISPKSKTFVPSGGSSTVGVTAPSGCSWSAASNKAWISITSGSSDSGNGTVHYSVLANSSTSSRTGTMTIAGKTFTVTQDLRDTTKPDVTITSPISSPTFETSSSSLDIGGTASDNVGVTQVSWSNDRGGSGNCSGTTTSWSKTGIALSSGQNVITVAARDAAGNTRSDTLTVTYTVAADISVSKDVDKPTPPIDTNVTFTITATNNGPNDATGVQVIDQLPAGLTYISDDSGGSYNSATGLWNIGNLANGASATLHITATVNKTGAITNTATKTASNPDDTNTDNDTASKSVNSSAVIPTVTTSTTTATGTTTASSGGNVTSDGGATVTARGVCWSTSPNPTTSDSKTTDGSGTGGFSSSITGLTPGTTYHVRAYATNSIDTAYGSDVTFITQSSADISVSKDVDNSTPALDTTVTFTITATNNGPNDATGVQVIDQLPAGLAYQSSAPSQGIYTSASGLWNIGNLANGASATLHITATVDKTGAITNTATKTASNQQDTNAGNDTGNAGINAPYDSDADGMPDEWENANGLNSSFDDSSQDPDEDGLSNLAEYQNGTKPNKSDSDNDDLPDGWEVSNDLDPLDSTGVNGGDGDFDNDNWTNYQEYMSGTDPDDPYSMPTNNVPTAPALNSPLNNSEITSREPTLSISNSTDTDDDTLTYAFEVYSNQNLTSLVTSISGVNEGQNTTTWKVDKTLNDNTFYYWRARAYDGIDYSEWMDTAKFFVNTANDPPTIPTLSSPPDDSEVTSLQPTLQVNNSTDMDLDPLTYEFEVYSDEDMTTLETSKTGVPEGGAGATSWQVDISLADNTFYWWRAQARDNEDAASGWTNLFRFFVNTANNAPSAPPISSPQDGGKVNILEPVLGVNNSTDEDLDTLTYFFEIDKVNTFDSPSLEQSPEVGEGTGDTTSWNPSKLDDNTTYYWRVRAYDGAAYSEWSTGSFFVNLFNDEPSTPTINNPVDNSEVNTLTPTLIVNPSTDKDNDQITYDFKVYSDDNLSNLVTSTTGAGTSWQVDVNLTENLDYYWEARAVDEHGANSEWSSISCFFVNTANDNPTAPTLNNPVSGGTVTSLTPVLSVNNSTDPDSDTLSYEFELYSDQNLSNRVASGAVSEGDNSITSWTVSPELTENTTYYWRVQASDGELSSSWMPTAVFTVNTSGANTIVSIEASQDVLASAQTTQTVEVTDDNSPIKGVSVEIPPGSLSSDCTITIGVVTNPPALPENTKAIGRIIDFGPSGITFSVPVTIMIPYTQADLDNAGITDPTELEVFTYNTSTLSWEKIPVDSVDTTAKVLICKVDHFSMYTTGKSVTSTQKSGGSSGGCFIATAAFGSLMEPHVQILREFRDRNLLNSTFERMVVNLYYKYSPPVAQLIKEHQTLRIVVRIGLMPLIAFSYFTLHFGFAITAGIAILIIGLSIILGLFFLRMLLDHRSDRLQQEEI